MKQTLPVWALTLLLVATSFGCSKRSPSQPAPPSGADPAPVPEEAPSAPSEVAVPENPLKEPYFGETHLHTAYSLDAYLGGTRMLPSDAYRFAKGAESEVNGTKYTINKPLDFVAVTDHAEYLGEMYTTMVEGAPGHDDELVKELRSLTDPEERVQWFLKYVVSNTRGDNPKHPEFFAGTATTKSGWQVVIDAAEEHNDPGKFTAFVAFEWSAAPGGANLHRNIIFRDANVPDMPMSAFEIAREEALWDWLGTLEAKGMKPLAIPHNSNASKGLMFPETDVDGDPIDKDYAQKRQHFEPLIEIMQIKGNSEVNAQFWAADEFADFENAPSMTKYSGRTFEKKNYVRDGVIRGMVWEQQLGVNPFKLGFVGGTDSHIGLPSHVAEDDWNGAHGPEDGSVEARRSGDVGGWIDGKDENPGTLTAVWATQNTRGAIWDSMKARETYATSGTRPRVRFFAGVGLTPPKDSRALVEEGYARGVPMGGTLHGVSSAPTFTVHAVKDPDGANLDRVQIIKGWVDATGKMHEKIIDVVWSGDRKPNKDGKLPPVGNTVDVKRARYTNTIGSPQLIGSWTDADFKPEQHALYYARVLEIPTPRWSTYDAVRSGKPLLEGVPATIQERAWTSPIWVVPTP